MNRLKTGTTVAGTEYKLAADVVQYAVSCSTVGRGHRCVAQQVHHGNDPCFFEHASDSYSDRVSCYSDRQRYDP